MARWSYRVATFGESADEIAVMEAELERLGGDGWELVTVVPAEETGLTVFFKRVVESPPAPRKPRKGAE